MERNNISIEGLVNKAKTGNQYAWSDLYQSTLNDAYFVAMKVTGNSEDALDLVQEAYLTAYQKLDQLDDPSKFQPWLNMIVANKCRDHLRKSKPVLFSDMETEDGMTIDWIDDREYGQPEITVDHKETVRLVANIIEDLPEDQKLCTILYYRDELSVSQIAKSLEVSEGTVKSRLKYSRDKVKSKVEALEKQGVKLYGLAPIPLLMWLLKTESKAMEVPASAMVAPAIASASAASSIGSSAAATTSAATKAAAAGAGTKAVSSGIIGKVIAGITAISVAAGGVALYTSTQNKDDMPTPPPIVESETPVKPAPDPREEAIKLYEELLTIGNTESGMRINYFAYIDLNQDDIPELLVADYEPPETMNQSEVYTYSDSSLEFIGSTGTYYDNLYLINGSYVGGCSRMGRNFLSMDDNFSTSVYKWNEDKTRNDPAITYANGEWEYITQEKFDYYNDMPDKSDNTFIQTAEIIELDKNTLRQPDLVEQHLNYTDAWGFFAPLGENEMYFISMVLGETGGMDCILSFAFDEQPVDPIGYYKGSYSVYGDTFSFKLDYDGEEYSYQFDPETYTLTQISENGVFNTHKVGDTFTLVKDKWNDAEKIKQLVEDNFVDF